MNEPHISHASVSIVGDERPSYSMTFRIGEEAKLVCALRLMANVIEAGSASADSEDPSHAE